MSNDEAAVKPDDEQNKPVAPKPTTLLAALIVAAVLVYNLYLDAGSESYDGAKLTYGLVFGMLFILGVDLSRFWPGGKDK